MKKNTQQYLKQQHLARQNKYKQIDSSTHRINHGNFNIHLVYKYT